MYAVVYPSSVAYKSPGIQMPGVGAVFMALPWQPATRIAVLNLIYAALINRSRKCIYTASV